MNTNDVKGPAKGLNEELTASCKAAARLMSESRDRPLSERDQIFLDQHLAECRNCMRFNEQLDFLSELARRYAAGNLQTR